eukprot:Trichotokara_eunicae@DN615_c0_g1_i2.p1
MSCQVCGAFGNSYYNPEEFPATRIDIRARSGSVYTISVFESGKIQSTGGCWPEEAKISMKKVAKKMISKLDYKKVKFRNFEVQNILAVIDIGFPISLHQLCRVYPTVDYEPERFPAVRVRVPMAARATPVVQVATGPSSKAMSRRAAARLKETPKEEVVTVNVFSTGKITFTGGKSVTSIQTALTQLKDYLEISRI